MHEDSTITHACPPYITLELPRPEAFLDVTGKPRKELIDKLLAKTGFPGGPGAIVFGIPGYEREECYDKAGNAYLAFTGDVDMQMEGNMRAAEEGPKSGILGLEERLKNLQV
jgi:hypothetical protein